MAAILNGLNSLMAFTVFMVFMTILTIGFIYEYNQGALDIANTD